MIWTKGTHQITKFQIFDCSCKIPPDLYFHRFLLLKVYKTSVKKGIEELCLMILKSDAKFEEELTCRFKIDMRNLTNFDLSARKAQKDSL